MATSQELQERYNEFHLKGKERVLHSKPAPPALWSGKTEQMKAEQIVAIMLGQHPFLDLLRNRLSKLAVYKKSFLFGRDFPAHVTVKQGTGVSFNKEKMIKLAKTYVPKEIMFNRVILDPVGNVLLASTEVPEKLSDLRTRADILLTESGVEPAPVDILHATVCRFVQMPEYLSSIEEQQEKQKLVSLVEELDLSRRGLSIWVPVQAVYAGTVSDLLYPPQDVSLVA